MKNIQIALIIALLLCLFPMPYGFYIFVRFYSFIVFSLMAYQCYHNDKSNNALLWGSLALLFQPFLKNNIRKGNMEYNRCYSCYFNSYFFIERKR